MEEGLAVRLGWGARLTPPAVGSFRVHLSFEARSCSSLGGPQPMTQQSHARAWFSHSTQGSSPAHASYNSPSWVGSRVCGSAPQPDAPTTPSPPAQSCTLPLGVTAITPNELFIPNSISSTTSQTTGQLRTCGQALRHRLTES